MVSYPYMDPPDKTALPGALYQHKTQSHIRVQTPMTKSQPSQPQAHKPTKKLPPVASTSTQAVQLLANLALHSKYSITCTYATTESARYIKHEIYKEWRRMRREGIVFTAPKIIQDKEKILFERR
jgi:hypothetical protein